MLSTESADRVTAGRYFMTSPPRGAYGPMRLIDLGDAPPDPWLTYRQELARNRREAAEHERVYRDHHHAVTA